MTAIEKTKKIKRKDIAIDLLEANPNNPNTMNDKMFNMLYENIETLGFIDPIFVVPHPTEKKKYRIIGGEHRWEVAKLLDFKQIPCTIVDDDSFDEDLQTFQVVRQNIIHGKMTPESFTKSVQSLSDKYSEEVFAEMFGFVDEEEFEKLLTSTEKNLPKELQGDFAEAKKEIKTIDDLSNVLNALFTNYGDTLPYGYMLIDYGGKDSVWLRMSKQGYSDFLAVAERATAERVPMDGVMEKLLNLIANKKKVPAFSKVLEGLDKVPEGKNIGTDGVITLDFLDE